MEEARLETGFDNIKDGEKFRIIIKMGNLKPSTVIMRR